MLQQEQHSVCCTEKQSIESQELDKLIICYYHSIDQRPNKFQGLIKVDLYTQLVESQYLTLRACNLIKGLLWETLSAGGWKTTNGCVGANRDSLSAQLDVDSTFSKQPWVRQTALAWGHSSLWPRKGPEWWNTGSENEVKNGMNFANLFQEQSKWSVVLAECFKCEISPRIHKQVVCWHSGVRESDDFLCWGLLCHLAKWQI